MTYQNTNAPSWSDFNDAETQNDGFDLIPKGTLVPVRMTIRPGGYDDPSQGWSGGYATQNPETGSVYLNCEFVVLDGPFARRKIWSLIGLHSAKGPAWSQMGRSFIRAILNSARRISPSDHSPQAAQARRITGFHDLDGLEFLVRIDVEKDQYGEDRNAIRTVIEPNHLDYAKFMGGVAPAPASAAPSAPPVAPNPGAAPQAAQQQPAPTAPPSAPTGKPAWAG